MKIISSTHLKELDKYTIANEPITSIDLMERAAHELTRTIMRRWDASFHIVVFAGPGNNGGDALAVARLLSQQNYRVEVFLFNTKGKLSEECQINLNRLKECGSIYFTEVSTKFDPACTDREASRSRRIIRFRSQQAIKRRVCCCSEIYQCFQVTGSSHRYSLGINGRRQYL